MCGRCITKTYNKVRQKYGNAASMMLLGSPNPLKQVGSTGFEPARDLTPTRPST